MQTANRDAILWLTTAVTGCADVVTYALFHGSCCCGSEVYFRHVLLRLHVMGHSPPNWTEPHSLNKHCMFCCLPLLSEVVWRLPLYSPTLVLYLNHMWVYVGWCPWQRLLAAEEGELWHHHGFEGEGQSTGQESHVLYPQCSLSVLCIACATRPTACWYSGMLVCVVNVTSSLDC